MDGDRLEQSHAVMVEILGFINSAFVIVLTFYFVAPYQGEAAKGAFARLSGGRSPVPSLKSTSHDLQWDIIEGIYDAQSIRIISGRQKGKGTGT